MNTNVKKYIFLQKQLFLRVFTPVFGFWFCGGNIEHQETAKKHLRKSGASLSASPKSSLPDDSTVSKSS